MTKYKTIVSMTPIHVDIEVDDEKWLWVESKLTAESMPNYTSVFLVQSLQGSAKK